MEEISGFPYFKAQFTKDGAVHDDNEVKQLLDFLGKGTTTDLFVISHGWNNDMKDAGELYKEFFARVRDELDKNPPENLGKRSFAVFGILWPSKKFTDDELIPSGAASFGPSGEAKEIQQQLRDLKGVFDNPKANEVIDQAIKLAPKVENDQKAAETFLNLIRSLPNKNELHADDGIDDFFKLPADEVIEKLSRPAPLVTSSEDDMGAASFSPSGGPSDEGEAAGLGSFFGGIFSAMRNALNLTTYFQMKERAGIVGRGGVYQALRQVRDKFPKVKLHLIGHSFGARLLTSAAHGPAGQPAIKPNSMALLQAAFSHNGFSTKFDGKKDGFFRKVVSEGKVAGPIIISHTVKDKAVGLAYAVASRLSDDNASGLGDASDQFGGLGRNGAQKTPEAVNTFPLSPVTFKYKFEAGKIYNLKADSIILGHSDIKKKEVAHALLCAVAAT